MAEFFNFQNPFLYLSILFGIFFGCRAKYIFEHKESWDCEKWIYQFWFNFLGAFIGWLAIYYLWNTEFSTFGLEHFVALIIAFIGITGNLPRAVYFGKLPTLNQ